MSRPVTTISNLPTAEQKDEQTATIHPLVRQRWALTADGSLRRTHSCSHLLAA